MPEHDLAQARDLLQRGLPELGVETLPGNIDQLLQYLHALLKWNRAYNLTAVRNPSQVAIRHLLDSAALVPWVAPGQRVLDIGTGAGLPGVVLAILVPGLHVTCLDGNGKKIRFIRQVVMELALASVDPVRARIESFETETTYDRITSRAFAAMRDTIERSAHCLSEGGQYLFMKGQLPHDELAALSPACHVLATDTLVIPGLSEHRHLVRVRLGS